VVSVRLQDPPAVRWAGAWAWLYLINVKVAVSGPETVSTILHHFWSLGVEEQFYLLWPFLVLASSRRGMMRICVGSFLLAIVLRIVLKAHLVGPAGWLMPGRLDALAAGGWVALALRGPFGEAGARRYARLTSWGAGGCLLAVLAASSRYVVIPHVDLEEVSIPLAALLFAAMIATVVLSRGGMAARLFSASPPRFLGRYSYAIYVFHQPLTILLLRAAVFQRAAASDGSRLPVYALLFASVASAAIVCALVSWHLWEKHFLRLKSRVTYGAAVVAQG
jgi:peptidoglycan/LPS O-acetylase OafA/YrhL